MTPPESPREVREVREAGLLQTLDQNREQGQCPPEMEFLDISLTKGAWLVVIFLVVSRLSHFLADLFSLADFINYRRLSQVLSTWPDLAVYMIQLLADLATWLPACSFVSRLGQFLSHLVSF